MARRLATGALALLLLAALAGLLAGLMGSGSALFDIANLAALPLALLAIAIAGVLAILLKGWPARGVLALVAAGAAFVALPPADAPADCAPDAPLLKLAWLNAHGPTDPAPIIGWLEREQPQAVAFAEMGMSSDNVRQAVRALYPFRQTCLASERCSTAIYARTQPLAREPLGRGDPQNRRGLSAALMVLGLPEQPPLRLMAVHLSHPLPLGKQRGELAELEMQIEDRRNTVILGDFNMTPRMHGLQDFAARNMLAVALADQPTWPLLYKGKRAAPVWQIDQMLVGRNWAVHSLKATEDLGSDHRGLIAEICRRG